MQSVDLTRIEVKNPSNPETLVKEWIEDAENCGLHLLVMNLATGTTTGEITSRIVMIQEILPYAAVAFTTSAHSGKVHEMVQNPHAAATIFFNYICNGVLIWRQINFKGRTEKLPKEATKKYFDAFDDQLKLRCCVAKYPGPVDWQEFKDMHVNLFEEVKNGKQLEMPDWLLAYKIVPESVDFMFKDGQKFSDRILFTKKADKWSYQRVMP